MHYVFHLFEKSREDTTLGEVKGARACSDVDVDKKEKDRAMGQKEGEKRKGRGEKGCKERSRSEWKRDRARGTS